MISVYCILNYGARSLLINAISYFNIMYLSNDCQSGSVRNIRYVVKFSVFLKIIYKHVQNLTMTLRGQKPGALQGIFQERLNNLREQKRIFFIHIQTIFFFFFDYMSSIMKNISVCTNEQINSVNAYLHFITSIIIWNLQISYKCLHIW